MNKTGQKMKTVLKHKLLIQSREVFMVIKTIYNHKIMR